jgi:hypothetical protein
MLQIFYHSTKGGTYMRVLPVVNDSLHSRENG